jgi:hypothetical protein
MKRVLTVGLTYTGPEIRNVTIDNLGLCSASVAEAHAAFALYDYDTILINPASYSHFLFGTEGKHSRQEYELAYLKRENNNYDIDTLFDSRDRRAEMTTAISEGATVVWCLSSPKRQNFFGYRETSLGFVSPEVARLVERNELITKKGRRLGKMEDSPFVEYFREIERSGWIYCLRDSQHLESIASTPEGYSLGGRVRFGEKFGWLLTPPTSEKAANCLIRNAIGLRKDEPHERYSSIFLSHTSADKGFVRRLRKDLLRHGVPHAWVDEAEIEIGDSLMDKIEQGMKETDYIGVVLSSKSITARWVKKELEIAITKEIEGGRVVVLPLLYERCTVPTFLRGKLYADFTEEHGYEDALMRLLRRLRSR